MVFIEMYGFMGFDDQLDSQSQMAFRLVMLRNTIIVPCFLMRNPSVTIRIIGFVSTFFLPKLRQFKQIKFRFALWLPLENTCLSRLVQFMPRG